MDVHRQDEHISEKFTAGLKLLNKFTGQWERLHRFNEQNICKSKIALDKLISLERRSKEQLEAMDVFVSGYKALSKLEEQISNISCDINNLEYSFVRIEGYLAALTERHERENCEKLLRNCIGNYEAEVQRHKIRAELAKDRLMSEHLQRVQDFEKHQQDTLEERRGVLAREFEAEKHRYLESTNKSKVE